MTLNREATYPNRRTYVLKVRSDATPDSLVGRVENLATGAQFAFASAGELLELMAGDLRASAPASPSDSTDC